MPRTQIAQDNVNDSGFLHEVADFVRQFIVAAFSPYRPEQHYMRGPGPACRARENPAS